MKTRLLETSEIALYDALASDCAKVFYGSDWRAVFGDALRLYGVFGAGGSLVGAFQLVENHRAGLRILRNAPFTPVCGPIFRVEAKHPVSVLGARREVLEAVADFLARQPRAIVSVSLDHSVSDVMPFCWKGFRATPRYTYQIDLRQRLNVIVEGFSSTRRRSIAKARKDGLTVARATDFSEVADLVKNTFSRQGVHLDVPIVERILFQFARPENSYGFVTRRDGCPIGCTFIVHDQHTAYYLLGGYDAEDRHHGAGALAMMESIGEAQRRGLTTFDFEGSMIPAIEKYFREFGGNLVHYFTVSRAWLPIEILLKFKRRSMF